MQKLINKIVNMISKYYLIIVINFSLYSIVGSLYFSEIAGLEPCSYCWYQRIFMYPLLPIALVGYVFKEKHTYRHIISLAIPGGLIALYQYYLQMTSAPGETSTCSAAAGAIACNQIDFELFGFITIPFLSLMAFVAIIAVCLVRIYWDKKSNG